MSYIPENNRNNPTKCCGNWGIKSGIHREFQCMFLACNPVFDTGICENPDAGFSYIDNIYKRPEECPFNKLEEETNEH